VREVSVTPTFFQAQVVIVEFFSQPVLGLVAGYFLNVASGKPLLGPLFGLDALREHARSLMPMFLSSPLWIPEENGTVPEKIRRASKTGGHSAVATRSAHFDHRCRGP
jgi:hypothetical protein